MASPPSAEATLHPSFAAIGEARQAAIAAQSTFFRRTHPRWLLRASVDRWAGLHQVVPTRGDCPRKKLSSGNCSRHPPSPNPEVELLGPGPSNALGASGGVDNCSLPAKPVPARPQPPLLHEA